MLISLFLSGCGGTPTVDCSSEAALDASIKRISGSLTEQQKSQFASDCVTVTAPALMKAAFAGAFAKGGERPAQPDKLAIFKPLDGLTSGQVHDKAEEVRRGIGAGRSK